jgi:chromate reductase, NAD(P)H dehydrogenase (quinone)
MANKKNVVAICGSTKATSSNLGLINAVADLTKDTLTITVFNKLSELPHFSPDLDNDTPPQTIIEFRSLLKQADGILICTPEYAMGVPGSLKNAIDWTVSSCEFSHKPTALITAASMGQKGHAALMETLKIIEAEIPESSQLIISYVKTKVKGNVITDNETLRLVQGVMNSLSKQIGVPFNPTLSS